MKYIIKFRIRHKLFLTLLFTSTIVAASLFLFLQWNFDRGFFNYVQTQEKRHIDQLANQLSGYYASQGQSWNFMVDNHYLWFRLHRTHFLPSREDVKQWKKGLPPGIHPPPGDLRDLGPRTVLYDADKQWVIGGGPSEPEGVFDRLVMTPIEYRGRVVGYIGVIPLKELSYSGDLIVRQRTEREFSAGDAHYGRFVRPVDLPGDDSLAGAH